MLSIRLLHSFEATIAGESLYGLGPQLRRFLAYLALEANHQVELTKVWQDLWPESDTSDVVRQSRHRLREALRSEAHRLQWGTGSICFDLTDTQVDVHIFERLIAEGLEMNDLTKLAEAVKLYRGELLADWE